MKNTKTLDIELLQRAALFTIVQHCWMNRKQAEGDKVKSAAAKGRLSSSKALIVCEEYDDIRSFLRERKRRLTAKCMPSFFRSGIWFADLSLVEEFEREGTETNRILSEEKVPALLKVYEQAIQAASLPAEEGGLGELWDRDDYPSPKELTRRFSTEHQWLSFGIPENLPLQIKSQEEKKLRAMFDDAGQKMQIVLRVGMKKLIEHGVEILTVQPGKQQRIIRTAFIENFKEFCETFRLRNLMQDGELEQLVVQMNGILSGMDRKALTSDESLRRKTAESFVKIKEVMDTMVTESDARSFDLDDE